MPPVVTPAAAKPDPGLPAIKLKDILRRCLACNPLYLVSAALLLYSFYQISADPNFLRAEVAKLAFNLGSLQLYEALVVATAIFLARRAVWYDSTLLVGLENLLVLVPFILVSQAALIDAHLVWGLCAAAGLLALTRQGLLKRGIDKLNAPAPLLWAGLLMLAVNTALPVVYRVLHESKFGTKPDWGAAYETNQYVWWLLAPLLCASSLLVPMNRGAGDIWPQRRWLPLGFFALWLTGTGVHLYCLDYVYDFTLRPDLVAPAIWALLWVLQIRVASLLPDLRPAWKYGLCLFPALATLLASSQPGKGVFLALTLLNVAIYAFVYYRERAPMVLHLLLISLVALIGGLPESWGRSLASGFSREQFMGGAAAIYLLVFVALSRNPKLGFLGSLIVAIALGMTVNHPNKGDWQIGHWQIQASLVFLLLHSLRWTDSAEAGLKQARWIVALAWVAHAFLWTHLYGAGWRACAVGAAALGVYLAFRWLSGRWGHLAVALAAVLVLLSAPIHLAATQLKSTPAGVLMVIGSFLLFGLGTLAALTRHQWAKAD